MVKIDTCHMCSCYALVPMIGIVTAVGVGKGTAAIDQIRVNNVNAIHEIYSEINWRPRANTTINFQWFTDVLTGSITTV